MGRQVIFEKNVQIPISDGGALRANIFRPDKPGQFPVVMAFGIYGKDVHFEDAYGPQWKNLNKIYPDLCKNGSSGAYLRWEIADPERWVPDDYIIIAIDARGSGESPGYLDMYSPRETRDYYECIEWAGVQAWSNGKVGLLGISYLAVKQWQVAALNPPHLAAIIPWEGASNFYRDSTRHGGIWSNSFRVAWWPRQALINQNGNAETTHRDRETGLPTTGRALSRDLLEGNRSDSPSETARHFLDDQWFQDRSAVLENIKVPLLSAANFGGPGNHLRGNVEGFYNASSKNKWLFGHVGTHYESFYLPQYVALQKRFFDYYLKGIENGWDQEPSVQVPLRYPDGSVKMCRDNSWPLSKTQWTNYFLDAASKSLSLGAKQELSSVSFNALGDGVNFDLAPSLSEMAFVGPASLRLWVSSTTKDMDLFVLLRAFSPTDEEVIFIGAHERIRVALGWLRASHRKLDPLKTKPWQPYHTHDEIQELEPNKIYPVDVEIWPTSLVLPPGFRLKLTICGKDMEVDKPGRLLHNDSVDRDPSIYGGISTIHTGKDFDSYLTLPLLLEY